MAILLRMVVELCYRRLWRMLQSWIEQVVLLIACYCYSMQQCTLCRHDLLLPTKMAVQNKAADSKPWRLPEIGAWSMSFLRCNEKCSALNWPLMWRGKKTGGRSDLLGVVKKLDLPKISTISLQIIYHNNILFKFNISVPLSHRSG